MGCLGASVWPSSTSQTGLIWTHVRLLFICICRSRAADRSLSNDVRVESSGATGILEAQRPLVASPYGKARQRTIENYYFNWRQTGSQVPLHTYLCTSQATEDAASVHFTPGRAKTHRKTTCLPPWEKYIKWKEKLRNVVTLWAVPTSGLLQFTVTQLHLRTSKRTSRYLGRNLVTSPAATTELVFLLRRSFVGVLSRREALQFRIKSFVLNCDP